MKTHLLAAASGLVFSSFLIAAPAFAQGAPERVDANGKPTTDSTPAEKAETAAINNQVAASNAAAEAQTDADKAKYQEQQQAYQSQQQQYRNQLERNKDQQEQYRDRTAAYESLRARFAAERAAYHRGAWLERYVKWVIVERDANLIGSPSGTIGSNLDAHEGRVQASSLVRKSRIVRLPNRDPESSR